MGQAEEETFDPLMVDLFLFSFEHNLCYLLTLIQATWKTVIVSVRACVCEMIFLLIRQEKHRSTTFTFTGSYEHKCFFSKH